MLLSFNLRIVAPLNSGPRQTGRPMGGMSSNSNVQRLRRIVVAAISSGITFWIGTDEIHPVSQDEPGIFAELVAHSIHFTE